MRKNGFTLIELLAVIVILAIIALIATPIILGIINDAREKANERSVELYASAVRNSIAAYQLTGATVPESFSDLTIQYDGTVECTTEELYADGSFYLDGCTVNGSEKEYSYGEKQEQPIEAGKFSSVCKPAEEQLYPTKQPLEAGYKYECNVDPNKDAYTFYVLNSDGTSVNLIMDSNINISGTAVKEGVSDKGMVSWVSKTDYTREEIGGTEAGWDEMCSNCGNWNKGPITAMNYLQTATAGWTNTNELTINEFTDNKGGKYPMIEYVVKARMPYYTEISAYSEASNNAYLYDNLTFHCYDRMLNEIDCSESTDKRGVEVEGIEHIKGVSSYWTLSSKATWPYFEAWFVYYEGNTRNSSITYDGDVGVRPVINLSI